MIQTLDRGSFDVGRVLRTLEQLGYTGPVGLQCFAIPGDCRQNLAHSRAAWRKLCEQLVTGEDQVGSVLKGGFPSFETPRPASAANWERQKPALRATLWKLLGVSPPRFTPKVTIDKSDVFDGYVREHVSFDNGVGDMVYGYLLIPKGAQGPRPAILYQHYHGGRFTQGKEELFVPAFAGMGNDTLVTGPALVGAGYVVFCTDAYSFGQRQHQGPAGVREVYPLNTEVALVKTFLLEGRSFWGMVVRDDMLALNYLASRPEVDSARIAALGMSMGGVRAWWLAAMDDRVRVTISVSCLPRCQDLIRTGDVNALDYCFAPGMLREKIDTETIVGLIAPRAHLTLTGDRDLGSPVSGVRTIDGFQEHLYKLYGQDENFRAVLYPGVGHEYTPAMWDETLQWLKKHL